jgi:hypothetical protein
MIQVGTNTLHSEIHKLINSNWTKQELPQQWKESIIVPIYKMGDKNECSNNRGIPLLQLYMKFFPIFLSQGKFHM